MEQINKINPLILKGFNKENVWHDSSTDGKKLVYTPNGRPVWVGKDVNEKDIAQQFNQPDTVSVVDKEQMVAYFDNFEDNTIIDNIQVQLRYGDDVSKFAKIYIDTIGVQLPEYISEIKIDGVYDEKEVEDDKVKTDTVLNNEGEKPDMPIIRLSLKEGKIRTEYQLKNNTKNYLLVWDFVPEQKSCFIYTVGTLNVFKDYVLKTGLHRLYEFIREQNFTSMYAFHTDGNKNTFKYSLLGFDYPDVKNKFATASQYFNLADQIGVELFESDVQSMQTIAGIMRSGELKKEIGKSYLLNGKWAVGKYLLDKIPCSFQKLDIQKSNTILHKFFNSKLKIEELIDIINGEEKVNEK